MEFGSGVVGSRRMMGVWGARVVRRRARKRPTQPPPAIRIGRGGLVRLVVVELVFGDEVPLVLPF